MKKLFLLFLGLVGVFLSASAATIEATPIESLASYEGSEPYVYDITARKYYALNNLNEYEEFGLYPEVSTLKVTGGGVTEIEYIAVNNTMSTFPYINTGYVFKADTRIVMECNLDGDTKSYQAPFGARSGYGSDMFVFFWRFDNSNGGCYGRNGEIRGSVDIPTQEKIKVDAYGLNVNIYKDGEATPVSTISCEGTLNGGNRPMYIFDLCHDNHPDNSTAFMKLYTFKIYEGETLVMDLVPVVDGEGKGALKDKVSGTILYSANNGAFALSPDGEAIASDAGITVYPGKLVINTADEHEYKWDGTQWIDLGSVYEDIDDTDYQNMKDNWECRFGYESTFSHIENSGNNNFFNPYKGEGGWEPYQCEVMGLTKGDTYRVSFDFTSDGWSSWSSYSTLPFFVTNNWDFGREIYPTSAGGEILGVVGLPQAAMTNKHYSFTFVADVTDVTMAIQFGVGADDPNLFFHFDNLLVQHVNYPEKYDITWVDPNKYTALDYVESTGAPRENPFTTPYIAKRNTEVDVKFQSYSGGSWRAIFSGRNGTSNSTGLSLYQNANQQDFGYFAGGFVADNFCHYPGHNQDITVAATLGNLNVNGTDYPTNQTSFNSSTRCISIFANPEGDDAFRGRIYYITLKEDGETIYDFQPVMRHDGVFGYYDKASKTFITPVQGNWNGYGFKKLDDKAYVTYEADTRIVIVGSTAQFLPDVQNLDGATFTWTSADESIATVAADGTVTGKKAGKVIITATTDADQGWTASYELTVSEPNYIRHDANNVGYAIVTGGNGWGDSPVSGLVDNDATTKFGCSGTGDAWAIIIASEPVAVKQYSFVTGADTYGNPGRTPRNWKLEGSNDNQNWIVIDQQEQNYKAKTSNKEETVFTVNGTDAYKFFKFTATAFDGGFQLGEFWINEQAHTWGEPVVTAATCTKAGTSVAECSDCHALKTEVLPIAAHNYKNGICETCSAKASEPVLLANGQTNGYIAKFRHMIGSDNDVDIEAGWNTANFDDSAWDDMVMPVGNGGTFHTRWLFEYNTFWFRRTFEVANPAEITKLTARIVHDDDYKVFINGTLVKEETGWSNSAGWNDATVIDIDPALLVAGKNVMAVYIEQNWGGAYCDFNLEAEAGAKVAVSDAKYATFVAPCDVDASAVKTYAVTDVAEGWVTLTEIADKAVPAGAAVVIEAEEGNYTLPKTTDVVALSQNELKAATAAIDVTEANKQYVLADGTDGVGFYPVKVGTTIAAGKGYLEVTETGAKFYALGGEETDVRGLIIENLDGTQTIYNLNGQKMEKAQKGVNIVNGHKFIVK